MLGKKIVIENILGQKTRPVIALKEKFLQKTMRSKFNLTIMN